jgi:hypothetical protein
MPFWCHLIWQQTSHNPGVAGSNPAPAMKDIPHRFSLVVLLFDLLDEVVGEDRA